MSCRNRLSEESIRNILQATPYSESGKEDIGIEGDDGYIPPTGSSSDEDSSMEEVEDVSVYEDLSVPCPLCILQVERENTPVFFTVGGKGHTRPTESVRGRVLERGNPKHPRRKAEVAALPSSINISMASEPPVTDQLGHLWILHCWLLVTGTSSR